MGGDSGPKRMHNVINKMFDCLKMKQEDLTQYLDSDEQAKLRAVNTEPDQMKALKEYRAEGRILDDDRLQHSFIRAAISTAKLHQPIITH